MLVPEVDYLDGLFQLVVLAPPDSALPSAAPFEPVLMDRSWVRARRIAVGDPSPWRAATKVSVGTSSNVRDGAAVTALGTRLVGRVSHAGLFTSDVSFLADPGFRLVAVARFANDPVPRVLGRLVSEGRTRDGTGVRFRWIVRVALGMASGPGGALERARLFTGSGDPGLPAGFFFGEALLPVDVAPGEVREIVVQSDLDPLDVRELFVRTSKQARGG